MNEWGISTIVSHPITIRPLTFCKWDSKETSAPLQVTQSQSGHLHPMNERARRYQHHHKSPNHNQTTYRLWMRQQGDISTIVSHPITIRSLTDYEWDSKETSVPLWVTQSQSDHLPTMNETARRHQHHCELPNHNQTTYPLWINETARRHQHHCELPNHHLPTMNEWDSKETSAPLWVTQSQSDHLPSANETARRHQHHCESPNHNQATYLLWMKEQGDISTIISHPITIRPLTNYAQDSKGPGQIGNHQHHSNIPFTSNPLTSYDDMTMALAYIIVTPKS